MPNFLGLIEKPFTNLLTQLGYAKASAMPSGDREISTILRGEIVPGAEAMQSFVDQTDDYLYKLGLANYAVYRNVMLIGKIVGEGIAKIEKKNNGKWEEDPEHEFTQIVEYRPNPIMSQSFIWTYQMVWLLLAGEAYWVTAEDETGTLKYLYPIPANRIEPIPNPHATAENPILGYSYKPVAALPAKFIDARRVCYHRLPNPFEYWRGLSPLAAYRLGLKINFEAQKTDLEDYTNRLRLQHLLSVKSGMSNREYNIALEDLQTAERNGNRWRLIRAGDFSAKEISKARDGNSTWIYKLTESQANGIFGIPDGIWSLDANRASSEQHRAILIESTVWPLMRMIAEDQTAQLVIPYYGEGTRVVFNDIRPRNRELDVKDDEWRTKKMTYDEVRAEAKLPPHKDPDIGNAPFDAAARVAVTKVAKGYTIDGSSDVLGEIEENSIEVSKQEPDVMDEGSTMSEQGVKEEIKEEVLPASQVEKKATVKGELKQWKAVCLRLQAQHKGFFDYDFKASALTEQEQDAIKAQLKCITEDFPISEIVTPKRALKAIFSQKSLADDLREEYEEKLQELVKAVGLGSLEKSEFTAEVGVVTDAYLLAAYSAGASSTKEDVGVSIKLSELKASAMESASDLWDNAPKYLGDNPQLDLTSKSQLWGASVAYAYAYGLTKNEVDPNLIWSVGPTDHCTDCLGNEGKVMKASEWQKYSLPQDRNLKCGGYRCECSLSIVS